MTLPYTPEFLESLRYRYEETREPVSVIAAEFGLDRQTISRIARRAGWRMRSAPHELPDHVRLADLAREAQLPARPRESGDKGLSPLEIEDRIPACAGRSGDSVAGKDGISALDRLEKLVLRELEIEEAQRAALGDAPRPPAEAAHKARAYATLLQTLQAIERARHGEPAPAGIAHDPARDTADDMPRDLDEFRDALARRIDAFVASRTDAADAARSGEPEMVEAAR